MNFLLRKTIYILCLLIPGLISLSAQTSDDFEKLNKPARAAWFACTSIPDDLENPVKVQAGEDLIELKLPEFMASDPVEIPEEGTIRIVRAVPDPEDSSKLKYLILAQVVIPEAVNEALIILVPLTEPKGDLVFNAVVQDLADFKGGDRMFINMSDTNIGVKLGETKVAVPAQRSKIYNAPALEKPLNMPIVYQFYHPEREEWMLLSASTVVLRPTRREICIFNNGTRTGNIRKHKILFPLPIE